MTIEGQETPLFPRSMLKSKIHRATVTQADVNYEGSVTVDAALLQAADILPFEEVHVWNISRGTRLTTYAIAGEAHSGTICINGAAAHLAQPGDVVILASFTSLDSAQARSHQPTIVFLDDLNRVIVGRTTEIPGPQRRSLFDTAAEEG